MNKKIKKQAKELYHSAKKLGLSNKDIKSIINSNVTEPVIISAGPPYTGGFYGTLSIKDFK